MLAQSTLGAASAVVAAAAGSELGGEARGVHVLLGAVQTVAKDHGWLRLLTARPMPKCRQFLAFIWNRHAAHIVTGAARSARERIPCLAVDLRSPRRAVALHPLCGCVIDGGPLQLFSGRKKVSFSFVLCGKINQFISQFDPFTHEIHSGSIFPAPGPFAYRGAHINDFTNTATAFESDRNAQIPDIVGEVLEKGHYLLLGCKGIQSIGLMCR